MASNRDHNSLHLFAIDPTSGQLSDIGQIATPISEIYGLCMFKDRQGAIHAIANDKDGTFRQYRLDGSSGSPRGELVRQFKVASQPEGCVADDRTQRLFVGEEDEAVWTLDARGDAPAKLEKVIGVGGPLHDDVEGLALYQGAKADYLVISSQGNDSYLVLDAAAPYAVRGAFRVGFECRARHRWRIGDRWAGGHFGQPRRCLEPRHAGGAGRPQAHARRRSELQIPAVGSGC